MKAGKISSGDFSCEKLISAGRAKLVLVAEDASENTKKKFKDACSYKKVNIVFFGSKDLLGRAIGKEIRAVLAVTEEGFAERIMTLITKNTMK